MILSTVLTIQLERLFIFLSKKDFFEMYTKKALRTFSYCSYVRNNRFDTSWRIDLPGSTTFKKYAMNRIHAQKTVQSN